MNLQSNDTYNSNPINSFGPNQNDLLNSLNIESNKLKFEETKKKYEYMKQITPMITSESMKSCLDSVKKSREDILIYERTRYLLPFLNPEKYPKSIRPQKKEQIQILTPKLLQYNEISPIFMQHISILINYIHSNPELFAKGILERSNKEDFSYITNVLVPTLYGFFVSHEYFSNAFIFYAHIVRLCKPDVCMQVVSPYFCSIGSFRFIEQIMSKFALKLQNEVGFDNPQKVPLLMSVYVNILAEMIINDRKLLPSQIKIILYGAKTQKWPKEDLISLFFDKFFTPMAIHWPEASTCSPYTPFLKMIIDNITKNSNLAMNIISKFLHESSYSELPSFYSPFKQEFRMYILSHAEAEYAIKIVKSVVDLPITLNELIHHQVHPDERHRPFFSCVFPKNQKMLPLKFRPLLFPESTNPEYPENQELERVVREIQSHCPPGTSAFEKLQNSKDENLRNYALFRAISDIQKQQENFEVFIWFSVHKNIINEWREVSMRSHECALRPLAHKSLSSLQVNGIENCLKLLSDSFGTPNLQRNLFMFMIIPKINSTREKVSKKISGLTEWWKNYIEKQIKTLDTKNFLDKRSNIVKEQYWDAVEYLKSVMRVPASLALDVINQAVKRLRNISRDKEELNFLLSMACAMSQFKQLLEVFLMINELVVKDSLFKKMMSDEEMMNWTIIERFILNVTSTDLSIQKSYLNLQNSIRI
ncbi:hypothetical protein TVAG_001920 [Trichomonas vaginalis G3]|uniref:Uncharacterized protein n=1 Tax=Trichomonas vaginalis (strain ATCC PRA-98 / G3) TaxID=412133 RepID=A2FTX7_TRIV3|nr:hypothetical protein TVAGG3_0130330 [Trichomonas vaginalis G3]EAX91640.1 hypothetical protein TVAG_001920 [Trichomonas vaginalis G3]KAI5546052.1 hypothetical protein TVAGG3_0130330 [Trichomonas vaginalis G3]|eukprot:XP_001304570.1 hypothetical protein [Trichomonas vaginalis G3]